MRTEKDRAERAMLPGHYANYFQVGHNAFEFLLDFGQVSGEGWASEFHTRIIVTPASARRFAELLQQAVQEHQRDFGGTEPWAATGGATGA